MSIKSCIDLIEITVGVTLLYVCDVNTISLFEYRECLTIFDLDIENKSGRINLFIRKVFEEIYYLAFNFLIHIGAGNLI